MKKLLSVLLALVMVFSLTVPAFAEEPQPPDWATLCAEQPEKTAQFLAELDTWFAEEYSYYDSFEEYCEYWEMSPEEVYPFLFEEWSYDPVAEWAALCAAQPERTAQFLEELPTWFTSEYFWYDSLDEYIEYRTCKEEAYLELFEEWNWAYAQEQAAEQAKRDFVTAHGGVPGQLNVMLNGQCVKFPDAVPELTGGRTMVPFRAIFETLGAEVTYDNGKVHATLGDTALELTIGSDTLTKTADGRTETVKMDCAPYIKGGRTYVPVRFISEALGYDVQWDGYYNIAVITDYAALAEQIDQDFTIYNKLLARNVLTDKTRKSVGSGKADVTLFDTLNGDKSGKATYSYDLAASTDGASGKLEYDFSQMWALIEEYIPMPLDEAGAEEYEKALELVKSLMKGSAEIRMDLNKGKVYLSMPGLFEAVSSYMKEALEESGVQLPKDAWLSASLDDMDMDELTGMMKQAVSIGKLLSTTAGGASVSGYYSAENYDNILEAAGMMAKLYGDAKFTRKNGANVLSITKADLAALDEDSFFAEELDALSKFDYTLTVKDNGDMDVSVQCNVALTGSGLNLGDMVAISSKSSTRGGKTETTMDFHIRNTLKATVKLQETVTETDKAPETTPPKDALVLPIDGTLPGGTVTSPDGPTQIVP